MTFTVNTKDLTYSQDALERVTRPLPLDDCTLESFIFDIAAHAKQGDLVVTLPNTLRVFDGTGGYVGVVVKASIRKNP